MKRFEYDQKVSASKYGAGSGNFAKTGSGGEASGSDATIIEKWWTCPNCGTTIPE